MEFGVANLELESDSRKSGVDSRFGFWPKPRFGVGVDLTPENLEFWDFENGVLEFGIWSWSLGLDLEFKNGVGNLEFGVADPELHFFLTWRLQLQFIPPPLL